MDTPATCKNCRFGQLSSQMVGECRRDPPVPLISDGSLTTEWPRVEYTDWCGRHEERGAQVSQDLRVAVAPFVRVASEYLRENPDAEDEDLILIDLIDDQNESVALTFGECRALVEAAG